MNTHMLSKALASEVIAELDSRPAFRQVLAPIVDEAKFEFLEALERRLQGILDTVKQCGDTHIIEIPAGSRRGSANLRSDVVDPLQVTERCGRLIADGWDILAVTPHRGLEQYLIVSRKS